MKKAILLVGPFPPPMTGMALGIQRMYEDLTARTVVVCLSTSPTSLRKGLVYHFTKMRRVLRAALSIITKHRRASTLYMSCDAGWGGFYTMLLLLCGRLLGYRIFLHHRSYAYLDSPTRLMATVVRAAGARATHIVLCAGMVESLRAHYGRDLQVFVLNNMYRTNLTDRRQSSERIFTLGLLSNLGPEKGLLDFIALMKRLIAGKRSVRGILAGPAWHAEDETTINKALADLGEALEWRGKVQGEQKEQFYRYIDVMVLPTHYRDEAQPNVVFEAMARGIPVIAFARGCIASDVAETGLVLEQNTCFEDAATAQIAEWLDKPELYDQTCERAFVRGRALHEESCRQQQMLLKRLCEN